MIYFRWVLTSIEESPVAFELMSKMNAVARAQLIFQMLTTLQKYLYRPDSSIG